MTTALQHDIADSLFKMTDRNVPFTWAEVRPQLESDGVKISKSGWMNVRNVLQRVMNQEGWARTKDVHTETFAKI